ncbi:hypothetical protein CRUP_036202, partial [Coryphaenoides rupestris]
MFTGARCDLYDSMVAQGCSAAAIITAKSSVRIEQAEQINVRLAQAQVTPQQMSMSFLPGEERVLDMEVFAPVKGPLDLYILMDFSNSMSDDLDNLKRMGKSWSLSDDYTIGFGKFVDKVVEPQTDMRPTNCQNVIKLTNKEEFFNSELQKERISGNLDAPEGGFDAILQATVCGDQIGWRNHSTHLLVFSTESAFHYEADGANYTQDTRQDYPSVPTLVRLMGKHNIIPIFAVTNHSYTYYEKLHKYFPIAELGKLQEDSSNILTIMEKAFQSIRSKMSIRAMDQPRAFQTQFLSASGQVAEYGAFQVSPGQIGKFKVRMQAQKMVEEQHVCQMKADDKAGT